MTLAANGLTIHLGGEPVVQDANLCLERGRVTAILGPNGAGKTSLIRALAGLIAPSRGSVSLDHAPLPALEERARQIGYLPQNVQPAWNLSVRELVGLGRLPHHSRLAALDSGDIAAINDAMAAVDVHHLAERSIDTLSGGEKARASLARVLAGNPAWIIADEPLANLDPPHQRDVVGLLRDAAARGTGVIAVLHQLNAAYRVADDVVLLRDGHVVAFGPAREALTAETLEATFGMAFQIMSQNGQVAIIPRV